MRHTEPRQHHHLGTRGGGLPGAPGASPRCRQGPSAAKTRITRPSDQPGRAPPPHTLTTAQVACGHPGRPATVKTHPRSSGALPVRQYPGTPGVRSVSAVKAEDVGTRRLMRPRSGGHRPSLCEDANGLSGGCRSGPQSGSSWKRPSPTGTPLPPLQGPTHVCSRHVLWWPLYTSAVLISTRTAKKAVLSTCRSGAPETLGVSCVQHGRRTSEPWRHQRCPWGTMPPAPPRRPPPPPGGQDGPCGHVPRVSASRSSAGWDRGAG